MQSGDEEGSQEPPIGSEQPDGSEEDSSDVTPNPNPDQDSGTNGAGSDSSNPGGGNVGSGTTEKSDVFIPDKNPAEPSALRRQGRIHPQSTPHSSGSAAKFRRWLLRPRI